ncbi:glucosaminidase domain-containing protein [Paucihalobacter sp.]|uniref:glucosaminidase domain-containing protein n=1 Tax=Paucihalobacter sp. TaxID=2850405 RepID=UPI002FDFDEA9
MNRYLILFFLGIFIVSCGPKKGVVTKKKKSKTERVVTVETPSQPSPKPTPRPETAPPTSTPINSTEAYINAFSDIAMIEMRNYKIPASITLAQGILESGAGRGRLAVEANNHFGIKCHGWTGEKIYHDDDAAQECFRKYDQALSSFEDHSKFLTGRSRYADLFTLKEDDYKGWARGLRKAGYATDRQYPEKLISLIERYRLYEYDDMVLGNKARTSSEVDGSGDNDSTIHTVKAGDTLYSLSKKYNTSVESIQQLNGLTSTSLSVGQILKIK